MLSIFQSQTHNILPCRAPTKSSRSVTRSLNLFIAMNTNPLSKPRLLYPLSHGQFFILKLKCYDGLKTLLQSANCNAYPAPNTICTTQSVRNTATLRTPGITLGTINIQHQVNNTKYTMITGIPQFPTFIKH